MKWGFCVILETMKIVGAHAASFTELWLKRAKQRGDFKDIFCEDRENSGELVCMCMCVILYALSGYKLGKQQWNTQNIWQIIWLLLYNNCYLLVSLWLFHYSFEVLILTEGSNRSFWSSSSYYMLSEPNNRQTFMTLSSYKCEMKCVTLSFCHWNMI